MGKWASNQSITTKFLFAGGATILLIMVLSSLFMTYFFYKSFTANKIHTIANNIERQVFLARIAEKKFVQNDLNGTKFYATGTSFYLEENIKHMSNVQVEIQNLIKLWSWDKEPQVEALFKLSDRYRFLFSEIVKTYQDIGFKGWGLLGEWRNAIHNVELVASPQHHPELHEAILQLRRFEKDYLLRGDVIYLEEIKTQLVVVRRHIAGISGHEASELLKEIDRYEEAFKQYLELQIKIGRTEKEGLQKGFAEVVAEMKMAIDHIYIEAKIANQKARRSLVLASIIIYMLGFGFGGAAFYYFSSSISARLAGLKNAVLNVARGHLDTKLAAGNKDEIGIVVEAFNKMTTDLNEITVSKQELRILSSKILEAQEDERKMVARELHDGIGQALTGIKYCIENGIRKLKNDPSISQVQEIDKAIPLIRDAVEEIRRISMGLRPSTLDDIGIAETIFWFCQQFEEIYKTIHIQTLVEVDETRISDTNKTAIFRIVQESLNNVAKHSQADLVQLSLRNEGDTTILKIEDNGVGFDSENQSVQDNKDQGFGLASMKERAELSGGALTIRSVLNKGTTLNASWPTT